MVAFISNVIGATNYYFKRVSTLNFKKPQDWIESTNLPDSRQDQTQIHRKNQK
jgi:hypothetical protein